ncbi:hypothetical protein A3L02_01100 [Thermococcus celer Vu 13 = JCM 8558]|uniref:Uncharacterized protein n=1 Tax=Thermococcus celer Vu 13 = JCM 8558 TaxID=1293037 RepID=A0A218P014_THECE|nr:hypothetical protein [Thermococcus celer]ASI98262.1 hypothetical protein A3L02_01100 [Thermococcus celer Vu 13 = JCM 8558]
MNEELEVMKRAYRRVLMVGLGLLLVAFALMLVKPFGRQGSLVLAIVIFVVAFIPLEFARRIARRMAMLALRGE